jgi:hypothetical protein
MPLFNAGDFKLGHYPRKSRRKTGGRLATLVTQARRNAEGPQSAARRNTGKHLRMLRLPDQHVAVCSLPN